MNFSRALGVPDFVSQFQSDSYVSIKVCISRILLDIFEVLRSNPDRLAREIAISVCGSFVRHCRRFSGECSSVRPVFQSASNSRARSMSLPVRLRSWP